MSETRIVRDAADAPPTGHSTSILVFDGDNPILDALIGCRGRVVYTAEDVEAAGEAVKDGVTVHFDEVGDITHVTYDVDAIARAAITAAGGVVADEGPLRLQEYPEPQTVLVDGGLIELGTGDTLYIVRAKEE